MDWLSKRDDMELRSSGQQPKHLLLNSINALDNLTLKFIKIRNRLFCLCHLVITRFDSTQSIDQWRLFVEITQFVAIP